MRRATRSSRWLDRRRTGRLRRPTWRPWTTTTSSIVPGRPTGASMRPTRWIIAGDGHPRRVPRRRDQPPAEHARLPTIGWRYVQRGVRVTRSEPPDWALPSWDSIAAEPEEGSAARRRTPADLAPDRPPVRRATSRHRPRRRAPSASGSSASARSPGRSAAPSAPTRAWPTCGSRARSGGSRSRRPATPTSRSRTSATSSSACGSATIGCARPSRRRPGLRVVAHGRIDLFEPQGALQLYVESIQPAGLGDLTLRFEALKARLAAEGLFDVGAQAAAARPTGHDRGHHQPDRRGLEGHLHRPRPALAADPRRARRRPGPGRRRAGEPRRRVPQGRALRRRSATSAGRPDEAPAVTILARGGGSLEDLWAFNDEVVVRAVVAHSVPVVCGVGHEADVTLADFAADVRAPDAVRGRRDRRPGPGRVPASRFATPAAGSTGPRRAPADAAREVVAERRALDRLSPAAQLAAHANGSASCSTGRPGRSARTWPRAGAWRTGSAGAWPRRCPAGSDAIADARALGRARFARRAPHGGRPRVARLGRGGPRRPGAAGDARPRLRHRPPRRRRRDRARPGGRAGRDALWRSGSHAASCPRRPTSADARRRMADLIAVVVFVAGVAVVGGRRDLASVCSSRRGSRRLTEPTRQRSTVTTTTDPAIDALDLRRRARGAPADRRPSSRPAASRSRSRSRCTSAASPSRRAASGCSPTPSSGSSSWSRGPAARSRPRDVRPEDAAEDPAPASRERRSRRRRGDVLVEAEPVVRVVAGLDRASRAKRSSRRRAGRARWSRRPARSWRSRRRSANRARADRRSRAPRRSAHRRRPGPPRSRARCRSRSRPAGRTPCRPAARPRRPADRLEQDRS